MGVRAFGTLACLVGRDGSPFLLVGDAAWSLIGPLSDEEGDTYLADRRKLGATAVLVDRIGHRFATHAPSDRYGSRPFVGRAFAAPNEPCFAHTDRLIGAAAKRGLVVLPAADYPGFAGHDPFPRALREPALADPGPRLRPRHSRFGLPDVRGR